MDRSPAAESQELGITEKDARAREWRGETQDHRDGGIGSAAGRAAEGCGDGRDEVKEDGRRGGEEDSING